MKMERKVEQRRIPAPPPPAFVALSARICI